MTGTLLIALMQKNCRESKDLETGVIPYHQIAYAVYRLSGNEPDNLKEDFFKSSEPVEEFPNVALREIYEKYKLPPGDYCIIPCTLNAGEEGEFLLRLYSEKPLQWLFL